MNLKFIKMIKIILVYICLLIVLANFTFVNAAPYDVSSQFDGNSSQLEDSTISNVKKIIGIILDIIRIVGTAIAIGVQLWISAKYMMAAPDEKANIKQYSINYTIGACILFGANILAFVKDFAMSAFE